MTTMTDAEIDALIENVRAAQDAHAKLVASRAPAPELDASYARCLRAEIACGEALGEDMEAARAQLAEMEVV